jgi:hypothetical protein
MDVNSKIVFSYQNQRNIDWKKVKKGKRNLNKDEAQKNITEGKKKPKKEDTTKKKEEVQEEEEDDLDITILDPKRECVETLGTERIIDYEIFYWEKITIEY